MSLAVYTFVALAAKLGETRTCEHVSLSDELDIAGVVSSAIFEGLNTTEALSCNVHVLSSDWHPAVFRPHVKVLCSPLSVQGVIAIPPLGFSVYPYKSAKPLKP
jgi:hypothetical protein